MFVGVDLLISLTTIALLIKMMWWSAAESKAESKPTMYIHPTNYPWWYLGKTHF